MKKGSGAPPFPVLILRRGAEGGCVMEEGNKTVGERAY